MRPHDLPPARWERAGRASAIAAQAWRETAGVAALEARFSDAAMADPRTATDRAIALLTDIGWARTLIDPLAAALAEDPMFDPPLKAAREGGRIGAVLFETAAARVTLSVASPADDATDPTVVVPGRIAVTRYVRTGGARLERWRAPPPTPAGRADAAPARRQSPVDLGDGRVVVQDGRRDGHRLVGATRDVVMLSVSLTAATMPLVREYDAVDGRLLRSAGTDDAGSRAAMLRRFLRASGRVDAADAFSAATGDAAAHVRWGAMREWLALDMQGATPRLAAMAHGDADDEVRAVATATLAMVRDRGMSCPA